MANGNRQEAAKISSLFFYETHRVSFNSCGSGGSDGSISPVSAGSHVSLLSFEVMAVD